ncbi:Signal-transduction histidine kinase senX3 [Rubripirellula amarantea]|uniref:histidine kinase n=1 Tax=Rubripirellula amarantea TaxID=2527999 RepID=A0A5C5WTB7_9BACT|nr:HAMP domain-containing sensor histidine kinase [Rubripirellula amarantea]TWT53907.1 Signal-transduction histidine kinase senX3 [Rubripirellula amarantea]
MPKRLFLALILLVAAPLVLLGWLSASHYRSQTSLARQRIDELMQSQLADFELPVASVFDDYEDALQDTPSSINAISQFDRTVPAIRTSMIVDRRGNLLYPPPPIMTSGDEAMLYRALPAIIESRPPMGGDDNAKSKAKANYATSSAVSSAWQVWFLDEGMQLIYWQRSPDGKSDVGTLLERSRWIADLAAALPDHVNVPATATSSRRSSYPSDSFVKLESLRPTLAKGFVGLVDERQQMIYRWGDRSQRRPRPIASRNLPPPLSAWRFELHDDDPIPTAGLISTLAPLAGVGVVLLALGGYVLTSVRRRMKQAQDRVSFASQVSHELRTPLTNIRLYAELAESDLKKLPSGDVRESLAKRLGVIDCESHRLGRLVSGVLEVIRDGRQARPPRLALANPNDVIEQALTQFSPSFAGLEIDIDSQLETDREVMIDSDLVEMILVNLFSNVEKYAASGRYLGVHSRFDNDNLVIDVSDRGPGIAARHRRMIFEPFARLDDSTTAPSGTGIGLTIARRLALRHDGSLNYVNRDRGATFRLSIPISRTSS